MPWILSPGVMNNFLRTTVVLWKGECRIENWASLFEPWNARGLSRQDASSWERIGRKQEEELQGVSQEKEQRAMAEPQAGTLTQATYPLNLRFPSPSVAFASRLCLRGVASPRKPTRSHGAAILKSHTKVSLRHKTLRPHKRPSLQVCAAGDTSDGRRWWQKGGKPNLRDVNSTQEFLDALSNAGEKLVVVEFFATWCGSCKALYPKLCQIAAEHPDIEFLKVNLDENKTLCKSLDVKVLPFLHFYRGADGRLDAFSCSQSKLAKLRDAIAKHNTDRCSIGPPSGLGEEIGLLDLSTQVTAGTTV